MKRIKSSRITVLGIATWLMIAIFALIFINGAYGAIQVITSPEAWTDKALLLILAVVAMTCSAVSIELLRRLSKN